MDCPQSTGAQPGMAVPLGAGSPGLKSGASTDRKATRAEAYATKPQPAMLTQHLYPF